jgi:hypothetical protein
VLITVPKSPRQRSKTKRDEHEQQTHTATTLPPATRARWKRFVQIRFHVADLRLAWGCGRLFAPVLPTHFPL